MTTAVVRPMAPADVEGVRLVSVAAFGALEAASGLPEVPVSPPEHARLRIEHLLATDPGGCWVGENDGEITGAAIALLREGVWGLSLLVVDPARQSAGLGRELLARASAYGDAPAGATCRRPTRGPCRQTWRTASTSVPPRRHRGGRAPRSSRATYAPAARTTPG